MISKKPLPPTSLQQFQRDFGRFLRDPKQVALPTWLPARAGNTYQELIFNNIRSFIDACFPVCQKIVSAKTWSALIRDFFRTGTTDDPMFTSIPAQFVDYLQNAPAKFALPEWFSELAHYEWVELAVDIDGGTVKTTSTSLLNDLETHLSDYLTGSRDFILTINPTVKSLHYQWAVHQISANHLPTEREETFIFVLRDHQHKVRFIIANAMTVVLVAFLTNPPAGEDSLLNRFATQIGFADQEQLLQFVIPLLADFVYQDLFTLREKP